MAFIDCQLGQNLSNIDIPHTLNNEFDIKKILTNQQLLIIDMQEKMDFIIPKIENELITIIQENRKLTEKSLSQEIEIRKIKQKNYQTQKYAESNYSMITSKLKDIEFELQRLDSACEVFKIQIEVLAQSGIKTNSYKAISQRLKI